MTEEDKEFILDHIDDALSEIRESLFAKGYLDRVEDLERTLWYGEVNSALMNLTTLLFEAGFAVPHTVYTRIQTAGLALNTAGFEHGKWFWERLKSQCEIIEET